MLTEIAKSVVGGVAELMGAKPQGDEARAGESGMAHPAEAKAVEPVEESIAGAVAAEVQLVLEAAQESASRIVADAREEAARIVAEARREAAVIEDDARQEAAEAVQPVPPVEVPPPVEAAPALAPAPPIEPEDVPAAAEPVDTPPDEAAVRLVAMNMALGGSAKPEIASQIEREFGAVPGVGALIDDVLSRVG